jgi:hypothetical protein
MRRIIVLMIVVLLMLVGCKAEKTEKPETKKPAKPVTQPVSSDLQFHGEAEVHGNQVHFKLLLENKGENTAQLQFSSGQQFEIVVKEEGKGEVYRYSKDKMFTQALIDLSMEPGDIKIWEDDWKGSLTPGKTYEVTFQLLTRTVNEQEVKPEMFTDTKSFTSENVQETKPDQPSEKPSEAKLPQNIKVEGKDGNYKISGEAAQGFTKVYYSVEDGHNQYVEETELDVSKPWSVQIQIPKEELPSFGVITVVLYVKNSSGETTQTQAIQLQNFNN